MVGRGVEPPVYPTVGDLFRAHAEFEEHEPRDLFYKAAAELIRLSLAGATTLSVAEALAVLLKTWNGQRYRFHGAFDREHFAQLEKLLADTSGRTGVYRERELPSVTEGEHDEIMELFKAFEAVLGPVGAAKALHLLAPRFFPLWDWAIATGYRCRLVGSIGNAGRYWDFLQMTKAQWSRIAPSYQGDNILKLLDEYNYCHFTKGWL